MYCEMIYPGIKNLKYCNISQTRSGGSSPMRNGSSWGGKKNEKETCSPCDCSLPSFAKMINFGVDNIQFTVVDLMRAVGVDLMIWLR